MSEQYEPTGKQEPEPRDSQTTEPRHFNRLRILGKLTIAGSIIEALLGIVYLVFVGSASFGFALALSGAIAGKIFHQGACIIYMIIVFIALLARILAMFLFPEVAIIVTGCIAVPLDIASLVIGFMFFESMEPLTKKEIKELARTQCACCSQSATDDEI